VQFHDIGTLIWVFVILLGVASSIRRSLRRAGDGASAQSQQSSQSQQAQAARQQPAAQQAALAQQLQAQLAEQQRAGARLVAQQRVVIQPPRPARAVVAPAPLAHSGIPVEPPPMHVYEEPRLRLAGSFATLFEKRSSMIRAIVAAEVLGSPRALAEQSIWSPRYTER
jgi:hypothetical protein